MEIGMALKRAARESGMSATKVAVIAGVTEQTSRLWMSGKAIPGGDKLMILAREVPGFARLLGLPDGSTAAKADVVSGSAA